MSQLGERLRQTREEQGISIPQAAAETRILQRYLIALEDGDYQHLPGDVYARGFVRNYAQYLGLPVEDVIELYRHERGLSEPIRVVAVTSAPRIRGAFVPSFFGVFFVVLLLIGISYLALSTTNQIGESAQAETPAPPTIVATQSIPIAAANPTTSAPQVAVAPTVAPASTAVATPDTAGAAAPTLAPTDSAASASDQPINGEVRVAADNGPGSWMNIIQDGKSVFQGTLRPGQSRTFTAQRSIRIRLGNAGAVSITVNGQEFGPLAGVGQVATFDWPR